MPDVVSPEERTAIALIGSATLAKARAFKITTPALYVEAAERLKDIKAAAARLAEKKKPLLDPANAVVKAIRELFRSPEAELEEAERIYKDAIRRYDDEQEELRRQEQARLDAIAARERQERERQAAAAAERARQQREAGNIRAAELNEARAENYQEQAQTIVAPQVMREPPKVAGVSFRENWSAEVSQLGVLVSAIAGMPEHDCPHCKAKIASVAGTVPLTAVEANMKFLNNQARALKGELRYPGVRAVMEKGVSAGKA